MLQDISFKQVKGYQLWNKHMYSMQCTLGVI